MTKACTHWPANKSQSISDSSHQDWPPHATYIHHLLPESCKCGAHFLGRVALAAKLPDSVQRLLQMLLISIPGRTSTAKQWGQHRATHVGVWSGQTMHAWAALVGCTVCSGACVHPGGQRCMAERTQVAAAAPYWPVIIYRDYCR